MNYIPKVAHIIAIHGSPVWYSDYADIQAECSNGILGTTGAEVVGGLSSEVSVKSSVGAKGGIGRCSINDIEIVDDYHTDAIADFFLMSSNSLPAFSYAGAEILKNTTDVEVQSGETYTTDDLLFFQSETMKVVSQSGTTLTVDRRQYSAFETDDNSVNSYFDYNDTVEQGALFGINSGGTHLHSGRWVVIYRVVTSNQGSWGTPEKVFAGNIETVSQNGGKWTLTLKSILELFDSPMQSENISYSVPEGFWGVEDREYSFEFYNTQYDDALGGSYLLHTLTNAEIGEPVYDIFDSSEVKTESFEVLGSTINIDLRICLDLFDNIFGAGLYAESDYGGNTLTNGYILLGKNKLYHILKNPVGEGTLIEGGQKLKFSDGYFRTFIDIGAEFEVPGVDLSDGRHLIKLNTKYQDRDQYAIVQMGSTAETLELLQVVQFDEGVVWDAPESCIAGDNISFTVIPYFEATTPASILHQFMVSTGENFNGARDNFTREMGLGIPEELIGIPNYAMNDWIGSFGQKDLDETPKDVLDNDLKLLGRGLVWESEKYRLVDIAVPKLIEGAQQLDGSNVITDSPIATKNYIAPVSKIKLRFRDLTGKEFEYNVSQISSQNLKKYNTWDFESRFLDRIYDSVLYELFSKLEWMSSDTISLTLEIPRQTADSILIGQTVLLDHAIIQSYSGAGYGAQSVPCLVIGKQLGQKSTIDLIFRLAKDPGLYQIYAPAVEVDIDASDSLADDYIAGFQNNCIGYWHINDDFGTPKVRDYSGRNIHGEINNGDSSDLSTAGTFDKAFDMSGLADPTITFSDVESVAGEYFDLGNSFQISFWIKPVAVGAGDTETIITNQVTGDIGFMVFMDDSERVHIRIDDGTNTIELRSEALRIGSWSHVNIKYDGGNDEDSLKGCRTNGNDNFDLVTSGTITNFANDTDIIVGNDRTNNNPCTQIIEHMAIYSSDDGAAADIYALERQDKGMIVRGYDVGNQQAYTKNEEINLQFLDEESITNFQAGWQDTAGNKSGTDGTFDISELRSGHGVIDYTGDYSWIWNESERVWLVFGEEYDY